MGQIKTIFAEGIYKANEARSFMRPGFVLTRDDSSCLVMKHSVRKIYFTCFFYESP